MGGGGGNLLLVPTPRVGPRDALRSWLSVRPSGCPSPALSALLRLQTTKRDADALAVTKMFPAPRSLPATAMPSGGSPGTEVAAGDPRELPADALSPSEEVKAGGGNN